MQYNGTFLVVLTAFLLIERSAGFLNDLLNLGPKDKTCPNWSEYSRCMWITQRSFVAQLPPSCRKNNMFTALQQRIPGGLETPYRIVRQILGVNSRYCGQCSMRLSCAGGQCEAYNSLALLNWFNALGQPQEPATRNLFGVHSMPCEKDTGLACVAEVTKEDCLIWPPPSTKVILSDPNYYNLVKSLKLVECIVLGGVCYCCCIPYRPDPCTAKCVTRHLWERYKEFPSWDAMQYNCPDPRNPTASFNGAENRGPIDGSIGGGQVSQTTSFGIRPQAESTKRGSRPLDTIDTDDSFGGPVDNVDTPSGPITLRTGSGAIVNEK